MGIFNFLNMTVLDYICPVITAELAMLSVLQTILFCILQIS